MRRLITAVIVSLSAVALGGCELASGTSGIVYSNLVFSGNVIGTITGQVSGVAGGPRDTSCNGTVGVSVLGDVTFINSKGSVTETQCWDMSGSTAVIGIGRYTITGGTGAYQGATGSGTSILTVNATRSAFTLTEFGTFNVPGMASAAATHTERALKTSATIRTLTVRDAQGNRRTIAPQDVAHLLTP